MTENRIHAVLDGIADACAQTKSLFLLRQPFKGNVLAELVCDSARKRGNCPVLGLFHPGTLSFIDESKPPDTRDKKFFEAYNEWKEWKEAEAPTGAEPKDPREGRPGTTACRDTHRNAHVFPLLASPRAHRVQSWNRDFGKAVWMRGARGWARTRPSSPQPRHLPQR